MPDVILPRRGHDLVRVLYQGGDGVLNLRAIPLEKRWPPVQTFCAPSDTAAISVFCKAHRERELYFGVALRKDSTSGTLENCSELSALFADLDFKDFEDGEAGARAALARSPLAPTAVVNSGNGLHPYWKLVEPYVLPSEAATARSLLRRLAIYLGADLNSAEPARVLRLPGTRNHKYQPDRPVVLEELDDSRVYQPSDFDDWLPSEPAETRTTAAPVDDVIPEFQRNATLTSLAGTMRKRGMTPAAIAAALLAENTARCRPPLPDAEVRTIADSIGKKPPGEAPMNGTVSRPFSMTSIGDLLAEPDETTDWIVQHRIPAGSLILFSGKPKTGKSTTCRDLAFAVATGDDWLGHPCAPGPVWYLALEEKRSEVRRHFRQMGARSGDPIRLFIGQAPLDIIGQLQALAEREPPSVIFADPFQRLIRAKDLNDYAEVTTKFDPLLKLARETGATMVLVHHGGKGERTGIDTILGSTALAGSVDNCLLLTRTDRCRVLSSVQRIGPDLDATVVLLDPATGRVTRGDPLDVFETHRMAGLILEVLRAASPPPTQAEIEDLVAGKTRLKRAALRLLLRREQGSEKLLRGEQVSRAGTGGRNNPFRYTVQPCSLVPDRGQEQRYEVAPETPLEAEPCSPVPAYAREATGARALRFEIDP